MIHSTPQVPLAIAYLPFLSDPIVTSDNTLSRSSWSRRLKIWSNDNSWRVQLKNKGAEDDFLLLLTPKRSIAVVISVLEDVSGPHALFLSGVLIKEQTHVGLLIFLGSAIGTAFVGGLFEHRVKTLSYGDGSSRIWEGPLLVLLNSFVVLIDSR
ncbi:hypothetical protein L484_015712 [Morus notabilis]|uniref:Uncharacterized protein n=1 Tax=Morus notabilis TaxID=981085 RepID=W9SPM4_9ROSA|nr:hypothetical protein L484_015712 [Morus notabilis]